MWKEGKNNKEGNDENRRARMEEEAELEEQSEGERLREEVDGVAALPDALLAVLHEVTQCEQSVVAH